MASAFAKATISSKTEWVRIHSVSLQPKKAKVYSRQAVVERNAPHHKHRSEDKLLKARWQKMQEPKTTEGQATVYNSLAAKEVGHKRQDEPVQQFQQIDSVRPFSAVSKAHLDRENEALIQLKKRKLKLVEDEDQKYEAMMQSQRENALRQEQEKALQRNLQTLSVAEYQLSQMKERELLKKAEELQDKKEGEILRGLDELHAQELRCQAARKDESKKAILRNQLEDISRSKLNRQRQEQKLGTEEQKAKLAQFEKEKKLLQRQTEQAERLRKLQIPKEIVWDTLAASKKEKATTTALREERRSVKDVAMREAELAKQLREKTNKRAAMLQSISDHRRAQIQEKEQKEKAEHQSSVDWLQAQKEADGLFLTNQKLKAQKIREDGIKVNEFNASLVAEKHAHLQQLKVKSPDQTAVREKPLQQYVQCDLHKAAENLGNKHCQEHQKLQLSCKETSKTEWVRIHSVSLQPKEAKVYSRQAVVERNALHHKHRSEDKLLKARWQKMQEPKTTEGQATVYNLLAAKEVEYKRQDEPVQQFQQIDSVRPFSAVSKAHLDRENEALIQLKKRKQKMAEDEDQKCEAMMQSRRENALRQEQEKALQRKLETLSVAEYRLSQMKERELLKKADGLQDKKDGEILRGLNKMHAQELRRQAERKDESKKAILRNQLEDISRSKLNRQRQEQKLGTEEQKAKLAQFEKEKKLLQRQTDQAERLRKLQIPKEIVWDTLAASKKEKAITTALREERRSVKDVASKETELAKQLREKTNKRAAMFQSISDHRRAQIQEKEQKEKAEHQSSVDWLQAQKEADGLFLTNQKLKAQKIREDRIKVNEFNASMVAEKHAHLQQLKIKSPDQTAVREKHLQQYVQCDLHKAAENLGSKHCQEHQKLQLSYKDTIKVDLRPTLLPPISTAFKDTLAANDATRGGFGPSTSLEGSNYLSADTRGPLPRLKPKPLHIQQMQDRNRLQLKYRPG